MAARTPDCQPASLQLQIPIAQQSLAARTAGVLTTNDVVCAPPTAAKFSAQLLPLHLTSSPALAPCPPDYRDISIKVQVHCSLRWALPVYRCTIMDHNRPIRILSWGNLMYGGTLMGEPDVLGCSDGKTSCMGALWWRNLMYGGTLMEEPHGWGHFDGGNLMYRAYWAI